ncbi:hypothetical protein [Streptacidiphilus sp. EB129]|uniref:hypothetical protein n=1 Tax=Streptacidiphilus sp. EB129 TaxID=3156262 RepID=UPI0035165034
MAGIWTWTRLSGWLTVLSALTTALWELAGIVPEWVDLGRTEPDIPTTHALLPATVTAGCALVWVTASLATRRRDRQAPGRDDNRLLGAVLGLTLALGGIAALAPAFEPHGDNGRLTTQIYQAGGGTHTVTVAQVLSPPKDTDTVVNHQRIYTADIVVDVPFTGHSRALAVRDVAVSGPLLSKGDQVAVLYAPTRPDLGARATGLGDFLGGFFAFGMMIFAVGPCLALTFGGTESDQPIAALRRFQPGLHLPVMALLCLAAGLDAVVVYTFPSTLPGWLLPITAAALLGLAGLWALRCASDLDAAAPAPADAVPASAPN